MLIWWDSAICIAFSSMEMELAVLVRTFTDNSSIRHHQKISSIFLLLGTICTKGEKKEKERREEKEERVVGATDDHSQAIGPIYNYLPIFRT